jgi:hypothetical protein
VVEKALVEVGAVVRHDVAEVTPVGTHVRPSSRLREAP